MKHMKSMCTYDRLPFSCLYLGSMIGTLYACLGLRSYIFAIIFSSVQIFALAMYLASSLPGGSAGVSYVSSVLYYNGCMSVLTVLT